MEPHPLQKHFRETTRTYATQTNHSCMFARLEPISTTPLELMPQEITRQGFPRYRMETMMRSPMFLDEWLEFNQHKWGLKARLWQTPEDASGLPSLRAVLYTDSRNRLRMPPRTPYLPVEFQSTPTESSIRLYRQRLQVFEPLAEEMYGLGADGTILLAPEVTDVRPWNWAGFRTSVRYTFHIQLPWDSESMDPRLRRTVAKSKRAGYVCTRSYKMQEVIECLQGTEQRKGFVHDMTVDDLETAVNILGEEHLRCYICYSSQGEPAASRLVLAQPQGMAVDWLAGTRTKDIKSGATQQLIQFILDDLSEAGSICFDFAGANIPSVALSKACWGTELVPIYSLAPTGIRGVAGHCRDYLKSLWRSKSKISRAA